AYEKCSFEWLIGRIQGTPNSLRMATVQDPHGVSAGWFVYVKQGGIGRILAMAARRRDQFTSVLLALFHDAWDARCVSIHGQTIPRHLTQLTEQHCVFRHPHPSVFVHSRDSEIVNLLASGEGAITQLDSGCWMPLGGV